MRQGRRGAAAAREASNLPSQGTSEDAAVMVRSEEELVVTTEAVPRERVRLVKRVVTETVTTTTEVRHEELHIERHPLGGENEAVSSPEYDAPAPEPTVGASAEGSAGRMRARVAPLLARVRSRPERVGPRPFEDEPVDLWLMEEQVVVTKRVVPRERVRLRKEIITNEEAITDTVRKEKVSLERSPRDTPENAS